MVEVLCGVHNEVIAVGVCLGLNKLKPQVWQRLAPHWLAIRQTCGQLPRLQASLSRRQGWAVAIATGGIAYAAGGWHLATTDVEPNRTGVAIVCVAFYALAAILFTQGTMGMGRWAIRRVKG